jgi:hypothetical protein
MITHGAPATRNAAPNWLKISESALVKDIARHCRDQAFERKPSNAWARKMLALIKPKNAVTVPIISNSIARPAATERLPRCTVKGIRLAGSTIARD